MKMFAIMHFKKDSNRDNLQYGSRNAEYQSTELQL